MKKRIISFLLVLMMIMSMLPSSAIALNFGDGTAEDPYQIGSTVTNDGSAEPEGYTVENTHWVRTEDVAASINLVCQKDEHVHVAESCEAAYENVECLLEGHPAEGELTTFTHEDGTSCTYDAESAKWMTSVASGYACGIEAHTHTTEAGCFEVTPAYTVWTLTADSTERVCEEGCILESEEEHLENGGQCLVWTACTLTEGCGLADGHEGDCTAASVFAPATITVTVSSGKNSSTVKNAYVVVGTQGGNKNDTLYKTNSSGVICDLQGNPVDFDAGTYGIWYGTEGATARRSFYYESVPVDSSVTAVTAKLSTASNSVAADASSISEDQWNWATCVYYNTTICDHIHIRVDGSYWINVGGVEHEATVSNPSMKVYVDGATDPYYTYTWGSSQSYEYTYKTDIELSSEIEVHLTVDLTYYDSALGENVTLEDVDIVYNNMTDRDRWIEFIAICDGIQGFDFTVSIQDIQEVIEYYNVVYQWRVYYLDGTVDEDLPASLGSHGLPASASGIAEGTEYVYNTGYVQGTSYYDYENGLLYTFHGWDTWSHNSTWNVDATAEGYHALDDGDTDATNNQTVTITADTWINGYWTVSKLDPSAAYLMVKKVVEVEDGGDATYVKNYLQSIGKMFISIDPGMDQDGDDAALVDVDYAALIDEDGYRVDVYQYTAPFIFDEYQMDVPGYTRTTVISTSGSNLSLVTEDSATVTGTHAAVYIEGKYDPAQAPYNLGTVTYTNTYTKKTGAPVSVYPSLYLLKSASDGGFQDGVVFTLYSDETYTNSVGTYTTANGGQLEIDFSNLAAGTYYLKETTPLAGYKPDPYVYAITLTAGEPVEELRNGEYVQVTYYTLSMTVPEGSTAVYREIKSTGYYSLHIYNEPIVGSLSVSKTVTGLDDEDKSSLDAVVIVHGPITRDSEGKITAIGSTWTLNLNAANSWTDSIADLPVGEYLIHESFASVHGYTWTGVTYGTLTEKEFYNNITSAVFKISDDSTHDHSIELTLTNYYEEWASADFYIKKVDPSGKALAGATFELFVDAACTKKATAAHISGENATLSAVTGADGYAHFSGYTVPEGQTSATFYLKETKAPAGYYLDSTVYKVVITAVTENGETRYSAEITLPDDTPVNFNSSTDLLTVTNSPVLGKLAITKEFPNGIPKDAKGDALITGIKVVVSGPNGYTNTVELNNGNGWSVTLENLALGTYTITELDASAPGYDWQVAYSKHTLTLTESNPGYTVTNNGISDAATITNTYTKREETYEIPTTLTVKKVGEDGTTPLAGAVFKLDRMSADGKTVVDSKSYTTNSKGIVVFDLLSGWIVNNEAKDGTYILSEIKAPDGYQLATESWTVTIKDDNGNLRVTLNTDKNIFENFWEWIIGGITGEQDLYTFENNVLTVKNIELADLTVTKSFKDKDGQTITPPEGAIIEVAVFDSSNNLVSQLELSASNKWTAQVNDIPAGTYTILENSPSLHGYTWKDAKFTVTGEGASKAATSKSSVTVDIAESADVEVEIQNNYTKWESVDFYVMKTGTDGKTPLAGATFVLYDAAGKDVTSQYLHSDPAIHTNNGNTTGSGGILHFHNFTVGAGQTATFTLKETSAPENHYSNGNVYYITISHMGTEYDITITDEHGNALTVANNNAVFNHANDVLTVVNEEILADIVIEKSFPNSALTLISVKVDVTGPNGYSNTVTLDNSNGFKVTLSGLSLGEYTIKEQDASKAGYALTVKYNGEMLTDGTGYKVTLTEAHDNAAATVKIENTYVRTPKPVEITVIKAWDHNGGKDLPESVEVVLYRDGKEHDTVTLDEKNGWKHTWTGLTDEYTWTVDEKEVPAGYTKNVEMTETVNEGTYSYEYTITNTKVFKYIDVTVEKIWNGSGVTHPTSVEVTLYRNGVAYDTVTLSADNDWKHTWENLTDEFQWEVDEPSVPSGYNKTVRVYNTYNYYISNTHEDNPKTGDFTDLLGLGALGMVGVIGFAYTAYLLFAPRKKGKYEQ